MSGFIESQAREIKGTQDGVTILLRKIDDVQQQPIFSASQDADDENEEESKCEQEKQKDDNDEPPKDDKKDPKEDSKGNDGKEGGNGESNK